MRHIDGTRDVLVRVLSDLPAYTGAEIGVADGRFALALCHALTPLTLYAIDPWASYHGNRRGGDDATHAERERLARERLSPYTVRFVKALSRDALRYVPDASLDFVFIDGNHDYGYVLEDITFWSEKVRVGGIVSGHDYYEFRNSGVIEAVEDYTQVRSIEYTVIGEMRKHRDDNANPCWYWVRP